jgi:palmitoyl-protein thioesterase
VKRGVFLSYIQHKVIQAQYFRGNDEEAYLAGNIFLPLLNNQVDVNEVYIDRIKSLNLFGMIRFDADTMVCAIYL